jgi:hypothetical protein
MPVEFVLSLQEALARMPEVRRPSADRLEMYASTFLIPLEYEKLNSLNCPGCGSQSWDTFRKPLSLQKMGLTGLISVLPATSTIIGANSVAARLS